MFRAKNEVIELPTSAEISEICTLYLQKFGKSHQIKKLSEEAAELTLAAIRLVELPNSVECKVNLIDELADVEIMLVQARMMFGNSDVDRRVAFKVKRMVERLKE